MKISAQGVNLIKGFEGFRNSVYKDIIGVSTIGYGSTGKFMRGLTSVTESQATDMLKDAVDEVFGEQVSNDLDRLGVNLNQNEFDAIVSMAYNVGVAGLLGSTLYSDIVKGIRDKNIITNDFAMWCKAGGVTVQGLVRRRKEEAEMFLKVSSAPVPRAVPKSAGNEFINRLQQELNKQYNAKLIVDGYYGPKTLNACPMVKITARGNITRLIQERLGVNADGIFGNNTLNAIKNFQRKNGVAADGIVGNNTWKQLLK